MQQERREAVSAISSVEVPVGAEQARETTPARRPLTPWVLLRACRPLQWSKNLLLVGAPAAAGVLGHRDVAEDVAAGVIAFCLLSSSTYLLNDVRDRRQDRAHPRKRHRPVASGALQVPVALASAGILAVAGLLLAALVSPGLAGAGGGYLALTAAYSLWLRHVVVLDMLAIAGGFVLRFAAGGVAAHVPLSPWFVIVTSCGAVFVVAGKRHAELFGHGGGGLTRSTLRLYSEPFLQAVLALTGAAACIAYAAWAGLRTEHLPFYALSVVPVVLWLRRYGVLVGRGAGEAPEQLILRDQLLLPITLVWALLFALGTYVGR